MRLHERAADLLLWVTAVIGVIAVVISIAAWFTGSRLIVVESGSMEPTHPVGSAVIAHRVDPLELAAGDVVALSLAGGQRVLHRVVDVRRTDKGVVLHTKGDANPSVDTEPFTLSTNASAWRGGAVAPHVGRVANVLRTPVAGFALAVVLLGPLALGGRRRVARTAGVAVG